jgi:hypothetical protein
MSKRIRWIALGVLVALWIGLGIAIANLALDPHVTIAKSDRDWWTGNEAVAMGDWDGRLVYDTGESATVERNGTQYTEGSYSYRHFADCVDNDCWAASRKECSPQVFHGRADFWIYYNELPDRDYSGSNSFPIFAVGDVTADTEPAEPAMDMGLYMEYRPSDDEFYVVCDNCTPQQEWPIGSPMIQHWYNLVIEWDLEDEIYNEGVIKVWKDGVAELDFSTLYTQHEPAWIDHNDIAIGALDWEHTPVDYSEGIAIYVDDVTIYGCSETYPTPTPVTLDECNTYGNSAMLNIASGCSAVIRFDEIASQVPVTATINYMGLKVYGLAVDEPGEEVTITPLNAIWGELTANYCNRLMWTYWEEAGASAIPEDRDSVSVGTLKTQLGWQQVELDETVLAPGWFADIPNAGIILHNSSMTGKWSIASEQWYDAVEDYSPQLIINWE